MESHQKIIAFDLDDVICARDSVHESKGAEKYHYCEPIIKMINIVNQCYENGNYIKIYTARGMYIFGGDIHKVYQNLYELTKEQLSRWGVRYHELIMGKAHYDLLIDDKAMSSYFVNSIEDIII